MQSLLNFIIKYTTLLLGFLWLTFPIISQGASSAPLVLTHKDKTFPVEAGLVASWKKPITLPAHSLAELPADKDSAVTYSYDPQEIYSYLEKLSLQINTSVVEPKLTIVDKKVLEFVQPKNGTGLNSHESTLAILQTLEKNTSQTELSSSSLLPKTSLSSLNTFGIQELVGKGDSNFKGSPKNRRHNIQIGVNKMTGILLAPKEEFSFNKFLGPVEEDQGFVPELVIKKDGTVPELGGGLCQVSSTVFRAAMNAGLPIKERKNHAYAVQYYSPQGTDATIYPGAVDLRFINDTPGYILIWPYLKDKDNLTFEIYGTKDGRQVVLKKPYQYDRKEDGSMKATWERQVTKDGATKTDVFKSMYQSPALFHKEEKFVSANPNPTPANNNLTPVN